MDLLSLIGISIGLSMDCFAVAIAAGSAVKKVDFGKALMMAFFFGGFQMLMPVLGWLGGLSLMSVISGFDHWIAFGLLAVIGGKMIYEAITDCNGKNDSFKLKVLLILAIATSIDALAAGFTFALIGMSITFAVLAIGAFSFAFSFIGVYIGKRFGHLVGEKMEILGGVILIIIGLRVLLEHIMV